MKRFIRFCIYMYTHRFMMIEKDTNISDIGLCVYSKYRISSLYDRITLSYYRFYIYMYFNVRKFNPIYVPTPNIIEIIILNIGFYLTYKIYITCRGIQVNRRHE